MILDHKLQGLSYKQTPNVSRALIVPRYLVMHYSASGTLAGTIRSLRDPKNQRSAHIVIGRNGETVQLAQFNQRCWHCGISAWKDLVAGNDWSIGVEMVNWGELERTRDGKYLSWAKTIVPESEVVFATHKNRIKPSYWHTYTPEQIARAQDIAAELVRFYGLEDVIGHEDIAPTRKTDPGPAFPMAQVHAHCYPITPATVHKNGALHFQLQDDGIRVTMSDDSGKEVTDYMTATRARALRAWLDQILPTETI